MSVRGLDPIRRLILAALVLVALLLAGGQARAVETLTWSAQSGGSDILATPLSAVVGGITVTTSATQSGGPWDVAPTVSRGNSVQMFMDVASGSAEPWMEVTLSFSRPVSNLAFTLSDFDGGPSGGWNDRIIVTASPAQTPSTLAVGSAVSWDAATSTAQATSNASLFDTTGDLRLRFARPVLSVTIRYIAAATTSGNRAGQFIWLENLSWDSGTVRVRKTTLAGSGGPFSFAQTNLLTSPASITTAIANVATPASPVAHEIDAPGSNVTLAETPASGWLATGVACVDDNSATTGNSGTVGASTGGTVTLDAGALVLSGADIVCTFSNALVPQLRLRKALPNGRVRASDQFTLNMTGMAGLTTTGTGGTATGELTHGAPTAGASYTLSEVAAGSTDPALYATAYSCTNTLAGGQVPSGTGTSFSLTLQAGDNLTCTFTNAVLGADLSIVKTASATSVRTGGLVSFTLTAANNGPGAANGAVIRDVPGAGLDCTTPSPTATCSAGGGAACPAATVPVANLQGPGGVTIPVLPAGGSVVIALQCLVTATGLP